MSLNTEITASSGVKGRRPVSEEYSFRPALSARTVGLATGARQRQNMVGNTCHGKKRSLFTLHDQLHYSSGRLDSYQFRHDLLDGWNRSSSGGRTR